MFASITVIRRVFIGGLFLAPCVFAGTITQDGTFSTKDQSLWQSGPVQGNFNFDCLTAGCFSLTGLTWDAMGGSISGPSIIPTLPGSWTLTGSLDAGYAGLDLKLNRSGGSVDVNYPVQLTYNLPNEAQPGQQIQVGTSYATQGKPSLQTAGESTSAKLDFVANISDTYHPLFGDDQVLYDASVNTGPISETVLSVDPPNASASWSIPGFSSGVSLNVPNQLNLSTDKFDPAGKLVVGGSANPPILWLDGDLADLIVLGALGFGIKIPPLSGSVGPMSYSFFSAKIQAGPSLHEDFSFGVNGLPITLTANTGETHTGKVGDNFFFTARASGPLVIDTSVAIDNTFTSVEGLSLALGFSWDILKATLGPVGIGPLANGSYPIASIGCLVCWTDTDFALRAFNTLDNHWAFH